MRFSSGVAFVRTCKQNILVRSLAGAPHCHVSTYIPLNELDTKAHTEASAGCRPASSAAVVQVPENYPPRKSTFATPHSRIFRPIRGESDAKSACLVSTADLAGGDRLARPGDHAIAPQSPSRPHRQPQAPAWPLARSLARHGTGAVTSHKGGRGLGAVRRATLEHMAPGARGEAEARDDDASRAGFPLSRGFAGAAPESRGPARPRVSRWPLTYDRARARSSSPSPSPCEGDTPSRSRGTYEKKGEDKRGCRGGRVRRAVVAPRLPLVRCGWVVVRLRRAGQKVC